MLVSELLRRADHRGRRPQCPFGVVGLIAEDVPHDHDGIPGEALDGAAGLEQHRDRLRPVGVQHREQLARRAVLGIGRELLQVGEENRHVALVAAELRELGLSLDALGERG